MSNIIEIKELSFSYPAETEGEGRKIFENLNLSVEEGSFTAVLGHNGCGKSTLAKQMNAILLPSGGKVYVSGMDTVDEALLFEIRKTCGMVFQNPDNQIVANVVEEDIAFAPENLGIQPEEIRRRVDEALRLVGMEDYREHAPHLLSGGQKQRVAIAGVIAMRPRCIVLDEPTAMLDPQGRKDVMNIIHRLHQDGITVILITHHMQEAAEAQRILVMENGVLIVDGTPAEVFSQTKLLRGAGLSVPDTVALLELLNEAGGEFPLTEMDVESCARLLAEKLAEA